MEKGEHDAEQRWTHQNKSRRRPAENNADNQRGKRGGQGRLSLLVWGLEWRPRGEDSVES